MPEHTIRSDTFVSNPQNSSEKMKKITCKPRTAGVLLALVLACVAGAPRAAADLVLSYESGPNMGQLYTGQFTIKLQGVAMGTLYNTPAGTTTGYGAGGSSGSVAAGIADLDAIGLPATGAWGSEDSWGVAQITGIYANDAEESLVWSPSGKDQQLTVMFYGEQDFYVNSANGETYNIDGVGLHVDLYLEDTTGVYTPYSVAAGAAGRTNFDQYAGVTDGDMLLSLLSTSDFLHAAGVAGGTEAEFSSNFNNTSLLGGGDSYLNVVGGLQAAFFNSNLFTSPFGTTADFKATFTTQPPSGAAAQAGWLISLNDPIIGNFSPIPEPSTYGLIGACALLGYVAFRRRFPRQTRAA